MHGAEASRLTPRIAPSLVEALLAALRSPAGAVVLEGGDGVFCEGLDLAWTASATADEKSALLRRYATLLETRVGRAGAVGGAGRRQGGRRRAGPGGGGRSRDSRHAGVDLRAPRGLRRAWPLPWPCPGSRVGPDRRARAGWRWAPARSTPARHSPPACATRIAGDLEAALASAHVARWRRAEPAALAAVQELSAAADEPDYLVGAGVARMEALLASEPARRRIARALAARVLGRYDT
jgi:hypothetical protein